MTRCCRYVNGVPTYVLRLGAGPSGTYTVGSGLPAAELEWLADEVNSHLATLRA